MASNSPSTFRQPRSPLKNVLPSWRTRVSATISPTTPRSSTTASTPRARAAGTMPALRPTVPISLDPSAAVLHYGQEIFEGLKAYRHADGSDLDVPARGQRRPPEQVGPPPGPPRTPRRVLPGRHPRARLGGQGLGPLRRRRSPVPAAVHDRHRGVPRRPRRPRGVLPRDRLPGRQLLRRRAQARLHLDLARIRPRRPRRNRRREVRRQLRRLADRRSRKPRPTAASRCSSWTSSTTTPSKSSAA